MAVKLKMSGLKFIPGRELLNGTYWKLSGHREHCCDGKVIELSDENLSKEPKALPRRHEVEG